MDLAKEAKELFQTDFSSSFLYGDHLISSPEEANHFPMLVQFVHNQFRALALDSCFPCPGAKSAIHRGTYMFGLYFELGSAEATEVLCNDLKKFVTRYLEEENIFVTFIASFVTPCSIGEHHFEHLLWKQLQLLHEIDKSEWCSTVSADPSDPHFAFSFANYSFFVVGLHAGSSRWARRFAWPTLVFNGHQQFDFLREEGKFDHFQQTVRTKDQKLQGEINPNLLAYRGLSAARQYSGRFVEKQWVCPFHSG